MHTNEIGKIGLAGLMMAIGMAGLACKEAEAKVAGVGDTMKAFIIQECESGDRYCQVCAYGGMPTIMAVGDLDDAAFSKDLEKIQKIVDANKAKDLTAFALYGTIKDGRFTPPADPAAAQAKLAKLKKALGITFPVTMVPQTLTSAEAKNYKPFTDIYAVGTSRTVMLAKANNKIVYAANVAKDEKAAFDGLSKAVEAL